MTIGEVAKILGVNDQTIRNWIDRDELNRYFSDGAAGRNGTLQRLFSEDDLYILNTIRLERSGRGNTTDWKAVGAQLASGMRHRDLPAGAIGSDTAITPIAYTQQVTMLQVERDSALKRVRDLEAQIAKLHEDWRLSERELNREVGRLQHEIEELKKRDP